MPRSEGQLGLFDGADAAPALGPGARLLPGLASASAATLMQLIREIEAEAPFRHLITPGGYRMTVAMTNCGAVGWVSDRRGYRYDAVDPDSGRPWPRMPRHFLQLASSAAEAAGFHEFAPDVCLINRYAAGSRLTLHQDRNERHLPAPIVSVSLGLPATFLWGGTERRDRAHSIRLEHGDVLVFGGPSRMNHHGVRPIAAGLHPLTGAFRYNLTFRVAR